MLFRHFSSFRIYFTLVPKKQFDILSNPFSLRFAWLLSVSSLFT